MSLHVHDAYGIFLSTREVSVIGDSTVRSFQHNFISLKLLTFR